jgi:hypothetical protein
MSSQNPCFEMFETSTAKVGFPGFPDLFLAFTDEPHDDIDGACAQPVILRQRYLWFHPELCFAGGRVHVDVHSRLFSGEEE